MNAIAKITRLLANLFTPSEFLSALSRAELEGVDGFVDTLPPAETTPPTRFFDAVAQGLERRGLVNRSLFATLVAERPLKRVFIEAVQIELRADRVPTPDEHSFRERMGDACGGEEVFLWSGSFRLFSAIRWDLDRPAGFYVRLVSDRLELPSGLYLVPGVGHQYVSSLHLGERELSPNESLRCQGVTSGAVLKFVVEARPLGCDSPPAVFRGDSFEDMGLAERLRVCGFFLDV